jgi:hypothetical protein
MEMSRMALRMFKSLALAAFAASACGASAEAATIIPVSDTASSSYPLYPASDAIDTGAGSGVSDWASDGQGAGSTLILDLGGDYNLTSANVTDRVTSGGGNNAFSGGTTDFTTEFSLQACANAACTILIGSPQVFTKSTPVDPTSPSDFLDTVSVSLSGQYIEYTVLTSNGVNPGLSNIDFVGSLAPVPEPASWALMLVGVGAAGGVLRRRGRVVPAA